MHTAAAALQRPCCPHEPTHPDIVTLRPSFLPPMVHTRAQRRVEAAAQHSMTEMGPQQLNSLKLLSLPYLDTCQL